MKTGRMAFCALLLTIAVPASAHRLNEYLQATAITLEQDRIQMQMRLVPGVAVFHRVFAAMDTDGNGILSETEKRTYAERVLGDLALTLNGERLRPRLVSWKFAKKAEMQAGRGEIQMEFAAEVSRRGPERRLVFENRHQPQEAVYLVNCLVPHDPNIQVIAQNRNYRQSRYELDYVQTGVASGSPYSTGRAEVWKWAGMTALLLLVPLIWRRHRVRIGIAVTAQQDGLSAR